jgi:hypothetical protein
MPKGKVVENGKQKVDVDPRTRYLNAGADDYYELGSSKTTGNTNATPRKKGGFFSALKRFFGFGKKEEVQEPVIINDLNSINDVDQIQDQTFIANEDVDPLADSGEKRGEAWNDQLKIEDYVANKPDESSFLTNWSREYNEPLRRHPVFETGAFWHSDGMHSHMALRYTKMSQITGRLERRRVGIGFASHYHTVRGTGLLQNEFYNTTDGSSETPITMDGFNNVVGAIERTKSNIDMVLKRNWFVNLFRSGKAQGTEFSGKYNVLTNNCNDFVIAMAKAAGVPNVAKLHDSLFGPMVAYKRLRKAAENGEAPNGTRIFFSHVLGWYPRERDKVTTLLGDFMSKARFGLEKDGIDPRNEPKFMELLNTVGRQAPEIARYVEEMRKEDPDPSIFNNDMKGLVDVLTGSIREAVECKTGKPHPKTTRYLLQLESIARGLITDQKLETASGSADDYDIAEKEAAVQMLTKGEKTAKETGKVAENKLFDPMEMGFGSQRIMGELLLHEIGASDLVTPMFSPKKPDKLPEADKNVILGKALAKLKSGLSDEGMRLVKAFIDARAEFLGGEQIARLLAIDFVCATGLRSLGSAMASLWSVRSDDRERDTRLKNRRDNFVNGYGRDNPEEDKLEREKQFKTGLEIAEVFREIVEAIGGKEKPSGT